MLIKKLSAAVSHVLPSYYALGYWSSDWNIFLWNWKRCRQSVQQFQLAVFQYNIPSVFCITVNDHIM